MKKSLFLAAAISAVLATNAQAEFKIGFIAPTTGQFAQIGNLMMAGAKYYVQEHGTTVAGKKIELLIRDDGGQPDAAKRIAQEFIVNDKVAVLAGFTFTPVALAVAPLSAEAKIPQVVVAAGASVITERSPYIDAKSGFCTGTLSAAMISPPFFLYSSPNVFSASRPGV